MISFPHDPSPAPRLRSGHPLPLLAHLRQGFGGQAGERESGKGFFLNPFVGLTFLALALALLQATHGVATDEAKNLLNIPYPHPPLLRFIIGAFWWMPGQAFLWRFLLALLLIQAVWLVWTLARRGEGFALGALWLLSAAVIVWAGQILLVPVIAVEALIFCIWLLKSEDQERRVGWVSLLWLASLFTAYQAILYFPIVAVIFRRMKLPLWKRIIGFFGPVALLVLYTATNPLAVASMVTAGGQNLGGGTPFEALRGVVWLWILGGSLVLSFLGTLGMLLSRRWSLLLSLLMVAAFVFLSYRPYYCLLFTPLFIAGLASAPALFRRPALVVLGALVCAVILVPVAFPASVPSPARMVFHSAEEANVPSGATALIAGSFGHEWQEAGPYLVKKYLPRLVDTARVVVCLADCPEVRGKKSWLRLTGVPVEAWVRPIR